MKYYCVITINSIQIFFMDTFLWPYLPFVCFKNQMWPIEQKVCPPLSNMSSVWHDLILPESRQVSVNMSDFLSCATDVTCRWCPFDAGRTIRWRSLRRRIYKWAQQQTALIRKRLKEEQRACMCGSLERSALSLRGQLIRSTVWTHWPRSQQTYERGIFLRPCTIDILSVMRL